MNTLIVHPNSIKTNLKISVDYVLFVKNCQCFKLNIGINSNNKETSLKHTLGDIGNIQLILTITLTNLFKFLGAVLKIMRARKMEQTYFFP